MPPVRYNNEYTLFIRLAEIEPAIWRRIVAPGQLTLHQLHHILQVTMGWTHSHLHQFIVQGANESTSPKKGATFLYEYDFGDSWKHEITVEDISPTTKDEPPYPWCLDGQRACPPEDVGGVSGYAHFLEAWRKRSHPEHQEMRQWVGKHFQPELFSVPQVNAALALFISLSNKP